MRLIGKFKKYWRSESLLYVCLYYYMWAQGPNKYYCLSTIILCLNTIFSQNIGIVLINVLIF